MVLQAALYEGFPNAPERHKVLKYTYQVHDEISIGALLPGVNASFTEYAEMNICTFLIISPTFKDSCVTQLGINDKSTDHATIKKWL